MWKMSSFSRTGPSTIEKSLVLSMQFMFGDDWNDAPYYFITFWLFGNDVTFLEWSPLIFVYLYMGTQLIQKQMIEHDIKSK